METVFSEAWGVGGVVFSYWIVGFEKDVMRTGVLKFVDFGRNCYFVFW